MINSTGMIIFIIALITISMLYFIALSKNKGKFTLAILSILFLFFTGCTKEDMDKEYLSDNPIVGRWISKYEYWSFKNDNTGFIIYFSTKKYETFTYKYLEDYRKTGVTVINNYSNVHSQLQLVFSNGTKENNLCVVKGDTMTFYNFTGTTNGSWTKTKENISTSEYTELF